MKQFFPLLICFIVFSLPSNTQAQLQLKEVIYYGSKSLPGHIPRESHDDTDDYTIKLYVIGWSKDGKLAYVYLFPETSSHGVGNPARVEVRIQDMATDKMLWSKDIYKEGESYEDGIQLNIPLSKYKDLKNKLEEHGITIQKWSGYFIGESYKNTAFKLAKNKKYPIIIQATSTNLGSKTIFKAEELPLGVGMDMEQGMIAGVINNPFEDRVALIYYKTSNMGHWEYMTDFILVGCHLKKGFK